jgi:hypothetical protein
LCADSFSDWEASRAVFVKGFVLKGITRQNKLSAKAGIDKSKRKRFDSPLHRYGFLRTGQLLLTTMMRGRDLYKSRVRISAPKQDFFSYGGKESRTDTVEATRVLIILCYRIEWSFTYTLKQAFLVDVRAVVHLPLEFRRHSNFRLYSCGGGTVKVFFFFNSLCPAHEGNLRLCDIQICIQKAKNGQHKKGRPPYRQIRQTTHGTVRYILLRF